MSKSDRVAEAARWFVLNCLRQRVRDNRLRGTKPRVIEKFPRILVHEQQWVLITDPVEKWGAPGGADKAMLDLLKRVAQI